MLAEPHSEADMAVDRTLIAKDMYDGTVGDLDQRVVEDGWTYYIHAVKRPGQLGRTARASAYPLGDLLIGIPLELFLDWRARRRPWTIGVVRFGSVGGWSDRTPRVVHTESFDGDDPSARITELAADVSEGRFHPAAS